MIDRNNLNRVKGILSAKRGAEIPKYNNGAKFAKAKGEKIIYSGDGIMWYSDINLTTPHFGGIEGFSDVSTPDVQQAFEIPGDQNLTPNSAIENAASQNQAVEHKIQETTVQRRADSTPLAEIKTPNISIERALNATPLQNKLKNQANEELDKISKGMYFTNQVKLEEQNKKNANIVKAVGIGTDIFKGVGDAFGAQQSMTDSTLTKGIDAAYNMAADAASQFGPVGQFVGTAMKTASTAGNILQGMGGGTDQMTATDKWMDSPIFSWWLGAANGFGGKKSENFGVDQNIMSQVGSSYGGSASELNDAANKAGKKYGLFSAKARRRANSAIAEARKTQNAMGEIADDANDQRMIVQSMGEQAGLNYSLLTDGGYNQKYTYAAKQGGILEWNPIIELEWNPKVELNTELPSYKKGGNVELNEELEWIPTMKNGDKVSTPESSSYYGVGDTNAISNFWDANIQNSIKAREDYTAKMYEMYPDDPVVRKKKKEEKVRQQYQNERNNILKTTDLALNPAHYDNKEKEFIINWLTETSKVRPDLVSPEFLEDAKYKLSTVTRVNPNMLNLQIPEELANTEEGKSLLKQLEINKLAQDELNQSTNAAQYVPNTHSYLVKGKGNGETVVHELAHIYSPEIIEQVRDVMKKHGIEEDDYWNNPYEIYSRLMALRYQFRFDKNVSNPSKRDYTWNNIYDIIRMYDDYDSNLIFKKDPKNNVDYPTAFIMDLWNNVASNDTSSKLDTIYDFNDKEGVAYAAEGGILEWIPEMQNGGSLGDIDIPETEETSQKNVIPEGALHKNKHHMEHAEGLTKKGIPVIDEEGEQQAEIEHSEIIFTLEVTKKLEEYYEIFYSDESSNKEKEQAALEAGKLLVYQILENTEDRTGLIESCKKGGSLTLKKSTDDLIEEVLDWMPSIIVIEEEEEKPKKKSEKEQMKEAIKEVLIELLTK